MKNINFDKVNKLVNLFCDLDDEFQNELIAKAYEFTIRQSTMKNQDKQGKFDYSQWKKLKNEYHSGDKNSVSLQIKDLEGSIDKEIYSQGHELTDMLDKMKKLNDEGRALFVMMMESLRPGSMTIEEELTVNVTKKHLSLKEYIEKNFPNVDYELVKAKFEETKNQVYSDIKHK